MIPPMTICFLTGLKNAYEQGRADGHFLRRTNRQCLSDDARGTWRCLMPMRYPLPAPTNSLRGNLKGSSCPSRTMSARSKAGAFAGEVVPGHRRHPCGREGTGGSRVEHDEAAWQRPQQGMVQSCESTPPINHTRLPLTSIITTQARIRQGQGTIHGCHPPARFQMCRRSGADARKRKREGEGADACRPRHRPRRPCLRPRRSSPPPRLPPPSRRCGNAA